MADTKDTSVSTLKHDLDEKLRKNLELQLLSTSLVPPVSHASEVLVSPTAILNRPPPRPVGPPPADDEEILKIKQTRAIKSEKTDVLINELHEKLNIHRPLKIKNSTEFPEEEKNSVVVEVKESDSKKIPESSADAGDNKAADIPQIQTPDKPSEQTSNSPSDSPSDQTSDDPSKQQKSPKTPRAKYGSSDDEEFFDAHADEHSDHSDGLENSINEISVDSVDSDTYDDLGHNLTDSFIQAYAKYEQKEFIFSYDLQSVSDSLIQSSLVQSSLSECVSYLFLLSSPILFSFFAFIFLSSPAPYPPFRAFV